MTLEEKISAVIKAAEQIRDAIDDLSEVMDQEFLDWSVDNQLEDDWALEFVNLRSAVKQYADNIPDPNEEAENTLKN